MHTDIHFLICMHPNNLMYAHMIRLLSFIFNPIENRSFLNFYRLSKTWALSHITPQEI